MESLSSKNQILTGDDASERATIRPWRIRNYLGQQKIVFQRNQHRTLIERSTRT